MSVSEREKHHTTILEEPYITGYILMKASFGKAFEALHFYTHKTQHLIMGANKTKIVCEANDNNAATMYLFGIIGDDLRALDFVSQLNELAQTHDTIVIHINSGGGSVFDGLGIYSAIKECKAKTIGRIDGICASMATVLSCAMDEVYMSRKSQFMTHKPSGSVWGSSGEMKAYANMMDNLELVIADVYMVKTGMTADQVNDKLLRSEDSWFSADQALAARLINGVYDSELPDSLLAQSPKGQKELVAFYNSHLKFHNNENMKQTMLSAPQLAALNLTQDATQQSVSNAIDSLIAKAGKADILQIQADNAIAAKANAENELKTFKETQNKARVDALLKQAIDVDKKITVETGNILRAQFGDKPEDLEKFLGTLTPITSVTSSLRKPVESAKYDKTWDELDHLGLLASLKTDDLDLFKAKFKERFGKEYK